MPSDPEVNLSYKDVSELLGKNPKTIERYTKKGHFGLQPLNKHHARVDGVDKVFFHRNEVLSYARKLQVDLDSVPDTIKPKIGARVQTPPTPLNTNITQSVPPSTQQNYSVTSDVYSQIMQQTLESLNKVIADYREDKKELENRFFEAQTKTIKLELENNELRRLLQAPKVEEQGESVPPEKEASVPEAPTSPVAVENNGGTQVSPQVVKTAPRRARPSKSKKKTFKTTAKPKVEETAKPAPVKKRGFFGLFR